MDCIKLSEETLNNKEDDLDETSPNFDEFLKKLDHQPNTNLIEVERDPSDQELIKYKNSLDPLDEFYDLDNWSDDINLFMQGLADPARSDKLWLKVKAKETWEKFQWNLPEITSPGDNSENPRPSEKDLKI